MEGNNEDEEPQICTVFSSTPSSQTKTIFDTIAFTNPKKENSVMSPTSPFSEDGIGIGGQSTSAAAPAPFSVIPETQPQVGGGSLVSSETLTTSLPAQEFGGMPSQNIGESEAPPIMFESLTMSYMDPGVSPTPTPTAASESGSQQLVVAETVVSNAENVTVSAKEGFNDEALRVVSKEMDSLSLNSPHVHDATGDESASCETESEVESPLPTANTLFSNAPEVAFPIGCNPPPPTSLVGVTADNRTGVQPPVDTFSVIAYSSADAAYDAWIPTDQTRQVLMTIATAVHAGTYFPEKSHMTTPGIIYKEDLVDKVAVNMSRIFGEAEASKRKLLTADSVTQDDNGIRELIKLGCYRSAINLTKRLLTLYGQGPGKIGQFSKHTPHSLQLWMTRIVLLVRIKELKIAESELEAFNNFENPDMYYEYYQDSYGQGRKGSMVPFYLRLIAAEMPQYASKLNNESVNRLSHLLRTVQQIIHNLNEGISENGSSVTLDRERRELSLKIWSEREIRVYYSLANVFLLAKDFSNSLQYLSILREKDAGKKAQLTSAIGRLFLQYGDLSTAQKYFKEAASMRCNETESERVENLVDAALYFIAQGVYSDAYGLLKEAMAIQPDNFMITNNMAVCLLYMGKVKESLALMETTVRNNTPQLLQENIILNLSTIYELENSDGFKKNALLKLISEYKGDGINLASLKMPNLI